MDGRKTDRNVNKKINNDVNNILYNIINYRFGIFYVVDNIPY